VSATGVRGDLFCLGASLGAIWIVDFDVEGNFDGDVLFDYPTLFPRLKTRGVAVRFLPICRALVR